MAALGVCLGCRSARQEAARFEDRGIELIASGKYQEAWGMLERARELGVPCPRANALQGYMLLYRGDVQGAESFLREALRLQPGNLAVSNNLAIALLASDRESEALRILQSATTNPQCPPQLVNTFGLGLRKSGDFKGAEMAFQRAKLQDPRSANATSNYAFALYLQRKFRAAITAWETAVYIDTNTADAWAGLALAHTALGNHKKAREAIRRLIFADTSYVNADALVQTRCWPRRQAVIIARLMRENVPARLGFLPSPLTRRLYGTAQLMENPEIGRARARLASR